MHVTKPATMFNKPAVGAVGQATLNVAGGARVKGAVKAFEAADRNGDGAVDQKEYLSFGKTGPSKAKLDRFTKADRDGDGQLGKKEFVAAHLAGAKVCKPCYQPAPREPWPAPAATEPAKQMGAPIPKAAPADHDGGLGGFLKRWALFPLAPLPVTAFNLVGRRLLGLLD